MKAARYYGIQDVRYEEVEKPVCGPDEALIKVAYAGICGSDLHIYNKGMFIQNIPETMGHEFAGVIEAVGDQVKGFAPGDAVIANPMVPCMACESCRNGSYNTCEALGFIGEVRPGCFGEYIAIAQDTLIPVPAQADLKQVALAEPLPVDSLFQAPNPGYAKSYIQQALNRARRQKQEYVYRSLALAEQGKLMRRHDIEMQKKFTLSFACIIFFFIGAPLGAIIKKGGLGTPLIISVLLFIVYFIIDNAGYKMARDGRWIVWIGMWLSTAILAPLGIYVTYKAMNDSSVFDKDLYISLLKKFRHQDKP